MEHETVKLAALAAREAVESDPLSRPDLTHLVFDAASIKFKNDMHGQPIVEGCSKAVLVRLLLDERQTEPVRRALLVVHHHFIGSVELVHVLKATIEDAKPDAKDKAANKCALL